MLSTVPSTKAILVAPPRRLCVLVLAAIVLTSSPLRFSSALADQATSEPAAQSEGLEEILVTAQKIGAERPQDVPMTIVALSEQTLENANVSGVQDLATLVPGLLFSETIGRQTTQVSLRGMAPLGFSDPTVVVFTDGFTLGFTRSENNAQLFDLERVEVLKGPQATLYGRNALGGVINYITQEPGNEFTGNVQAEYSSYNSYRWSGTASGPIIADILSAQIAVGQRYEGGFLTNVYDGATDVNSTKDTDVRAVLKATPSDALQIKLNLSYSNGKDGCGDCSHVPASFGGVADAAAYLKLGAGLVNLNDYALTTDEDYLGSYERNEHMEVLDIQYKFDDLALTSITGSGESNTDLFSDLDRLPTDSILGKFFQVAIDNKAWSEELRLATATSSPLQWLVGLYAFDNTRPGVSNLYDSIFAPTGEVGLSSSNTENKNYAGFGNLSYQFDERWTLGAGLRYDKESVEQTSYTTPLSGASALGSSAHVFLPKASLAYKISDDLNVYTTVSRGYHAGAPNAAGAPVSEYGPEYVLNYEIGLKGAALDERVRFEVATYFLHWTNMQIQSNFNSVLTYIANDASSRIYGMDATLAIEPVTGLSFMGSVELNDAKYTHYFDTTSVPEIFGINPDYAGHDLVNAPRVSATSTAQYEFPLSIAEWHARVRGDVKYTSSQQVDPTNVAALDGYTLVNLSGGIENKRYVFTVFADNAFDRHYSTGALLSSSTFPPLVTLGRPRTVGVRARVNF